MAKATQNKAKDVVSVEKTEIRDLKSRGYDLWATIQACQNELNMVNRRITELTQKPEADKET